MDAPLPGAFGTDFDALTTEFAGDCCTVVTMVDALDKTLVADADPAK